MLILLSSPVLLRVFLLGGMLIWPLLILWVLVLLLMLLVSLAGRKVLIGPPHRLLVLSKMSGMLKGMNLG